MGGIFRHRDEKFFDSGNWHFWSTMKSHYMLGFFEVTPKQKHSKGHARLAFNEYFEYEFMQNHG